MHSSLQIAEWFLAHEAMPPKKLQELVYYTQAWSNALLKNPFYRDINAKIAIISINIAVSTI